MKKTVLLTVSLLMISSMIMMKTRTEQEDQPEQFNTKPLIVDLDYIKDELQAYEKSCSTKITPFLIKCLKDENATWCDKKDNCTRFNAEDRFNKQIYFQSPRQRYSIKNFRLPVPYPLRPYSKTLQTTMTFNKDGNELSPLGFDSEITIHGNNEIKKFEKFFNFNKLGVAHDNNTFCKIKHSKEKKSSFGHKTVRRIYSCSTTMRYKKLLNKMNKEIQQDYECASHPVK